MKFNIQIIVFSTKYFKHIHFYTYILKLSFFITYLSSNRYRIHCYIYYSIYFSLKNYILLINEIHYHISQCLCMANEYIPFWYPAKKTGWTNLQICKLFFFFFSNQFINFGVLFSTDKI